MPSRSLPGIRQGLERGRCSIPHISSADRRQQFIEAAIRVIEKHGIANATTRKIAQEAGAPLASLHYCFGTKDDLLVAVSDGYARSLLTEGLEHIEPGMGLKPAVAALLESAGHFVDSNLSSQLGELELYVWGLRTGRRDMVERTYDTWREFVGGVLESARADDEQDEDVSLITRMVGALIDGYAQMKLLQSNVQLSAAIVVASRTVAAAIDAGVFRRE